MPLYQLEFQIKITLTESDGNQEIRYDDGYFHLVDKNGYVITYGYR